MKRLVQYLILASFLVTGVAACDISSPTEGHEKYDLRVGETVTLQGVDEGSRVEIKYVVHEDDDETEDFNFLFRVDRLDWSPNLSAKYRYHLLDGLFIHGDAVSDVLNVWYDLDKWEVVP